MKEGEENKERNRESKRISAVFHKINMRDLGEIWTHDVTCTRPRRRLNQYDSAAYRAGAYSLHHEFALRFSQRFIWLFAKF